MGSGSNLLLVVWERRWTVLAIIIACVAVAVAYLSQATPIYQSHARLYVEPSGPRIMSSDRSAFVAQSQNFLYTQAELIMSWDLLSTVPQALRRRGMDVASVRSFNPITGPVEPTAYLSSHVFADVGKRNDIITVWVKSPHAQDAAMLANAVVDAFYAYHEREQQSSSRKILELLFTQRNRYQQELAEQRKSKLAFLRQHRLVAPGDGRANPALERLNRLSNALTEVEIDTLQARAGYESTQAMMQDPEKIRQLLDTRQFKSETESLRREVRELKKRLSGMSGQYLPNFPELTAIRSSLEQLNAEMIAEDRRVIDAYFAELQQRLATSQRLEEQLRKQMQAQRAEVLELNDVGAQFQIIDSEIAALERASAAIDERIKELSLTEGAEPLNIRTVEAARVNLEPVEPAKAKILFYALAGGMMLGVGVALLRDWLDPRLRSVDGFRGLLNLPLLGVVPHIPEKNPHPRGRHAHLDPVSAASEAFRAVRTAIYFGTSAARAKSILVTSPAPGDGKTTLACNLAIVMAHAGSRVLLLDADLRKPAQHQIFQLGSSTGLSTVLAGDTPLDAAMARNMIPGLDVLPGGPVPANPSEILNSRAFIDILEELSRQYDHVIIDSPPLLPVTDARIVAGSCDGVVLAMSFARTARRAALQAHELLSGVGASVIGMVINDVPQRQTDYAAYYKNAHPFRRRDRSESPQEVPSAAT